MFTDTFEIELLSALVRDNDTLKKAVGLADSTLFASAMSSDVFDILKLFYEQYDRVPTSSELIHSYKRDRLLSDDNVINQFIEVLYTKEVDTTFVLNELHRYVRLRKMENLFKSSYDKVKSGSDVDVSSTVNKLFKIQLDSLQDKHIYGVGIDESEFIIEKGESRVWIPTNVSYLNDVLGGGLRGGQLGIVLAPPNFGKTMTLLNFAVYAFIKRHNVLFITLEMPEFSIVRRILSIMSGALNRPADIKVLKAVTEHIKRRFMILYKPVHSINVDYLFSVYHQAEADGIKFDAIYIDYADLMRSVSTHKDKRFELAEIFYALKSLAQILDIPIWSATQANRDGMKSKTVSMVHMSEDITKAHVSDVILSLNDKVSPNKVVKFFLTKSRESSSDIYIDTHVNENMWFSQSTEGMLNVDDV